MVHKHMRLSMRFAFTWNSSSERERGRERTHEQSITAGELHLIPFYPILVWYFNWIWLDSNEWTHFEWNCLHKHTYLILSRSSKKEKERVNGVQPSIFNQRALTHFNYIDTRSSSFFWCFKLHYCLLCLCSMWTLFFRFVHPRTQWSFVYADMWFSCTVCSVDGRKNSQIPYSNNRSMASMVIDILNVT